MKKTIAALLLCALCASASACSAPAERPSESTPVTNSENIAVNLPDAVLMNTENFSVTDKMTAYSLRELYSAFCDELAAMKLTAADFGIIPGKPLSEQEYFLDDSAKTWLEYFAVQAEYAFTEQLVLCEAAKEAGVALDETDKAAIDAELEDIYKTARKSGKSENAYIAEHYGTGVNAGDIRDALELSHLAEKYLRHAADTADISEFAAREYANAHADAAETVDVLVYVFAAGEDKYADDLAAQNSAEDFLDYVRYYATSVRGLSDKDFEEVLGEHILQENLHLGESDDVTAFAFTAESGETKLTKDKSGSITVVRVTRGRSLNEKTDENGTPVWLAEVRALMETEAVENATKDAAAKYPVTADRTAFYETDIKG